MYGSIKDEQTKQWQISTEQLFIIICFVLVFLPNKEVSLPLIPGGSSSHYLLTCLLEYAGMFIRITEYVR
ncbi:hypothetical protein HMPREF0083_02434 [Aneurinibacillus aneurinilyticus ATCC 12856]|uniref:Uncharacterized protein n=1 Tax=Aneurinibacillus aneurinilyticus ATCC 12856 TaxID=649747 RepID=U1WLL5_ANEAE|nr:hypothetical protein HMPREF0083_02434 [Aneurinibacillus aneurinilyticus ATCC 12856]